MPEINLEDLLTKQKDTQAGAADVIPQQEMARVTQEIERITPEERKAIDGIKAQIDLVDSSASLRYGNAAQKNIADFSNGILASVKGKDARGVGNLLSDLVARVQGFDAEEDKGFFSSLPIVGTLFTKKEALEASYTTLAAQVDKIQAGLDNERMQLMKDIVMFDGLYEKNLDYFKQLQLFIQAGEEKLVEIRNVTLPKLQGQARTSSDPMAVQVVKDFEESVNRFEKKVHDLKISKVIAIQTAPQIRLIQNNDKMLVDRIQNAIYNTIPLWKNQMVLALGMGRQREALAMQRAVTDATNDLLKKNAEMLRQNTTETAIENERSVVDVATVKKVNDDLIATIEEALRIQQEGRQKRMAAEQELVQIEAQLKQALIKGANR